MRDCARVVDPNGIDPVAYSVTFIVLGSVACGGGPSAARLHADCSSQACASGQTCLAYYGFGGTTGPLFKTCEIQCSGNAGCPAPTQCGTTADGPPGSTCR